MNDLSSAQLSEQAFKRLKPNINYLFHTEWKLRLILLLAEGPQSIHDLKEALPVCGRNIYRNINYLRSLGFRIEREFHHNTARYQLIGFSKGFTELIENLFYISHQIQKRACATISQN